MTSQSYPNEVRHLQEPQTMPAEVETAVKTSNSRLLALDAFRGLTVFLMLLVNNVALDKFTPDQLLHAPWGGGLTLADMVFPWFLFATGTSIPLAFTSSQKRNSSILAWIWKVIKRSFWLFALGCLMVSSLNHAPTFSLGVLQLIALAFLIGALCYPLPVIARGLLVVVLLGGYWASIRYGSLPGFTAGIFEESNNFIHALNRLHLESLGLRGLTSAIPTAALVIISSFIGDMFKQSLSPIRKGITLMLIGLGLVLLGSLWSLDLEFNKAVWTPSYILFSSGTAAFVIGGLTVLLDGLGTRALAFPFAVFGSNALLAYIAPILLKAFILQDWQLSRNLSIQQVMLNAFTDPYGTIFGGWLYTIFYIVVCWLGLLWLYQKKWFFRV